MAPGTPWVETVGRFVSTTELAEAGAAFFTSSSVPARALGDRASRTPLESRTVIAPPSWPFDGSAYIVALTESLVLGLPANADCGAAASAAAVAARKKRRCMRK